METPVEDLTNLLLIRLSDNMVAACQTRNPAKLVEAGRALEAYVNMTSMPLPVMFGTLAYRTVTTLTGESDATHTTGGEDT